MSSFTNSFWSIGYGAGLNALYTKLEQGCVENTEMIALAAARADAEEVYGVQLVEIGNRHALRKNGFARDDGASMRQAYAGILGEMTKEGEHHLQVCHNIRKLVVEPFGAWNAEHTQRVQYSRQTTAQKVREYEHNLNAVEKAQKRYFNKCRLLEELKEQRSDESSDDDNETELVTSQELELNGKLYTDKEVQELLAKMLKEVPRKSHRVPILGTYENTSSGADIVQWIQAHVVGDLHQTEKIGQEMVDEGILRLVGQVGSRFANSSVMMYQWRPRAFELAGLAFNHTVVNTFMGSSLGETISDRIQDYYSDSKLSDEVRDLDQKYRKSVVILDNTRSQLEELVVDHLRFMEKCELDRLKALKAVGLDLVAAQSNVVPSIQASVDKQLLYQESMNPVTDLRYIIESYRTGPKTPQVTIYDNYYSSSDGTVFGMDLELRARGDGKPVPFLVSMLLAQIDKIYPRLESDEVRLKLWTEPAPLKDVHNLRRELNFDTAFDRGVLEDVNPQVLVGTLQLYLFELPDSVLPSQHYEIFKAIYQKPVEQRLPALTNTLGQLRLSNIATLDVVTSHINRLVSIAKPSDETFLKICKTLAGVLLRPKQHTAHNISDNFGMYIVQDLVKNKEIFKELRKSAQKSSRTNSVRSERSSSASANKDRGGRERDTKERAARESVESRLSRIASQKKPSPAPHSPQPSPSSLAEQLDQVALEAESFQDAEAPENIAKETAEAPKAS